MTDNRQQDPRSVARDIPGISDLLFPGMTASLVTRLNRNIRECEAIQQIPIEILESSGIDRAMLFEVAFARCQQILDGQGNPNWHDCLEVATNRQKRYFDARVPEVLANGDVALAERVAQNLVRMLCDIQRTNSSHKLIHSPAIAGYEWISSTQGDFSIGAQLIEVKCTRRRFSLADYRQVLMYWLLNYAYSIEQDSDEWTGCVLLNPRLNHLVEISFGNVIGLAAGGRSKVEILELFSSIVGDHGLRAVSDFGCL